MRCWRTCVADWHLVSDEPSTSRNSAKFRENRHDQSCLSLLLKNATDFRNEGHMLPPSEADKFEKLLNQDKKKLMARIQDQGLRFFRFATSFHSQLCPK